MKKALTTKIITSEEIVNEELQHFKETRGFDLNKISDGYHTFGELYEHRITLFIALCNFVYSSYGYLPNSAEGDMIPWKSLVHSDGSKWDGWFIAGMGTAKGKQISYHLPIKDWDRLRVVTYDKAPEWDGHTPKDVLERLDELFMSQKQHPPTGGTE